MMGAAWQTVGFLSQLTDKGKGKEVTLVAQMSLTGTTGHVLSHVCCPHSL